MTKIQLERRRERASTDSYAIENRGEHPVFSRFSVRSPRGRDYEVWLRNLRELGADWCTCLDFRTNGLGTCKHREAVLQHLERREPSLLERARRAAPLAVHVIVRSRGAPTIELLRPPLLPCKAAEVLERFFDDRGRLRPGVRSFDELEAEAAARDLDIVIGDDARAFLSERIERERRADAGAALLEAVAADPDAWQPLAVKLYPYQVRGGIFLATAGRAVLADDMGLGKTLQAIAAADHLRQTGEARRVLVVCPASLKAQWAREVARGTGETATIVDGSSPRRRRFYARRSAYTIVHYDSARRDLELVCELEPDVLILDEAQRIKNWRTKTAQAIKRFPSKFAFLLTGTPLENSLDDLYSILELVDPRVLGPLFEFNARYFRFTETGKVCGWKNLDELRARTAPVVLRRRKEDVLDDLPQRIDERVLVTLTPRQASRHNGQIQRAAIIVDQLIQRGYLTEVERRRLLSHLNQARRISNSIVLYDRSRAVANEWRSPKLIAFERVLDEHIVRVHEKAVVFTEWQDMQDLVERVLRERGVGFVRFCGSVPVGRRPALIERFENDPRCSVFLSTDCGGLGLNLQAAGVVINLDQPWNPARLEQRVGRIHRLGQRRSSIRVINIVAQESIEERILDLQGLKLDLASASIDADSHVVELHRMNRAKKFLAALVSERRPKARERGQEDTREKRCRPRPARGEPDWPDEPEGEPTEREGDERTRLALALGEDPAHVEICGRFAEMPVVNVDEIAKERTARARDRALADLVRAREKLEIARCVAAGGFDREAVVQSVDALHAAVRAVVHVDPEAAYPGDIASTVALALAGPVRRGTLSREDVARLARARDLRDGMASLEPTSVPATIECAAIVVERVGELLAS